MALRPARRTSSTPSAATRCVRIPGSSRKTHLAISPFLGQMAHRVRHDRRIYRALRPGALSVLLYIGERVHSSPGPGSRS